MTDLFLRSAEFSNFRIYGDSYAFEFPPGPGVTLITGGNGLGKTSFFDGLEWALTDQVGRFNDIPSDGRRKTIDPLTRVGAPEKSHRVSLQFSDGSVVDRGGGFEANEAEIIRLLKRPEWAEISNLHGYLSITHFFGQASAQRFSLKKPTDQWEALKGPAGVDRINTLRERMSGLGVRRAFTRAIDDRSAKLNQARSELAAWTQLIGERDRARQLASSEHAIAPSDLRVEAEKLAKQIAATGGDASSSGLRSELPEAVLESLATLLRAATERGAGELELVEELTKVLNAFEAARSESLALSSRIQAAERKLALARDDLKQADARLLQAAEALQASELEASHTQSRLISLSRVAAAAKQLDDAQARIVLLKAQYVATESAESQAAARCEQLRKQHAYAMTQRLERRALADSVSLARVRARIHGSLVRVQGEIVRVLQLLSDRRPTELRAKRAQWADEAAAANQRIGALTSELRKHDDRLRAITEAVSAIAQRLGHDDTSCPVCASIFAPGELLQLVRTQQAFGPSSTATLAAKLSDARAELETLHRHIAEADRDLADAAQLEASLATYRTQEGELRQQLVEAGGSADGNYSDTEVGELEKALRGLDDALTEAATPESLSVLVEDAEAAVRAEAAKRVSLQQLQASALEEIQISRSVLLGHPDLWSNETGVLFDLVAAQGEAELRARTAGERVQEARSVLDVAQTARDSLHAAVARESGILATDNARLESLSREQEDCRRRWAEAGQTGEPDIGRLAAHRQARNDVISRLKPMEAVLDRLIAGYRKWLDDEQLRKLEQEISSKMRAAGVASEPDFQVRLAERVEQATRDLNTAQAAKEKADEVGAQMQEVAKTYAGGVLVPLNATIRRFARTLMTWSDAAVSYKAEHHATRSELRPSIIRNGPDGSTSQLELNPSLYFSEGQLSALSVAALFAASTTFGWSRWRCLLLDDPLQHNDVIHASAFMDLLRQMVLGLRYQIILSTHDSAEAEFLSRKCRSAGIPYTVHELVPSGSGGLVTSPLDRSHVLQG